MMELDSKDIKIKTKTTGCWRNWPLESSSGSTRTLRVRSSPLEFPHDLSGKVVGSARPN